MISRILSDLSCGRSSCQCATSIRRGHGLTHCVSHQPDTTPSLNVDPGNGDTVLVKCHGGCDQKSVIDALKERGLWGVVIETPTRAAPWESSREVARYTYRLADGTPSYDIIRFEPKTFRASRTLPEAERILYNLDLVTAAVAAKKTVYVVEGEKDADSLTSIDVAATTSPFGAGKFLERYAEPLIGANVVIWADKDEPGRAHAKDVAQKLSVAARSVKIIESPVGKDATDWLTAGGSVLALSVLVDDAPEWDEGEKVIWTANDLSREYRETLQKRIDGDPEYVGWRTGFYSLDKEMRYRPGDLWVVAAATSVGKSALMQSFQRRCPVPSITFSLEMSRTQILDRVFAAEANVDAWKLSTGALDYEERARVNEAIDRFATTDMQIADNPSLTTSSIEAILRVARVRFGIRVAYVDYAGLLLDRDGESRYVQMSNVSHALKRIAMGVGLCMVVGSQVNRKGDRKSGEPPFIDEIRDSGVVGEDADVILALGRQEGSSEAKLAVRKARNALAGYQIPLTFDASHAQFIEPSEARRDRSEPEPVSQEIPF